MSVVVGHDGDLYAIMNARDEVRDIYNQLFTEYIDKLGTDNEQIAKTLVTNALYQLNVHNTLFEVRRYHNE